MFEINKVCIIGGDKRQAYLGAAMINDGRDVTYFGLDSIVQSDYASLKTAVSKCDAVILPMPLTKDGTTVFTPLSDVEIKLDDELCKLICKKNIFCANSAKLRSTGDYSNARIYDYLDREELAVLNAVPTAEGALAAAINSSPLTLHGSDCLIAGYGRIGKLLARDLRSLGARVTVSARRQSDLAWITACGFTAVNTSDISAAGKFDFIFNTIPAMIFDETTVSRISNEQTVVIDLASKPGGVDIEACRKRHITAFAALSLPGKTAPETAAKIIRNTIYNMSREEHP